MFQSMSVTLISSPTTLSWISIYVSLIELAALWNLIGRLLLENATCREYFFSESITFLSIKDFNHIV